MQHSGHILSCRKKGISIMGNSGMMGPVLLMLVASICWTQVLANNCTECDKSKCPPILLQCYGGRAIDPCGCCEQCAKQALEPCGGPNWELGYCDRRYTCGAITGLHAVKIPEIGVCKGIPGYRERDILDDDEEGCPLKTYCYLEGSHFAGQDCYCLTKRACNSDLYAYSMQCGAYDHPPASRTRGCTYYGCDLVDNECVCATKPCNYTFQYKSGNACYSALVERLCANVTCPEPKALQCPPDSVRTKPHTPLGECCPSVPSCCTCDFSLCPYKCPSGRRRFNVQKSVGVPGKCCSKFLCLLG